MIVLFSFNLGLAKNDARLEKTGEKREFTSRAYPKTVYCALR